MRIKLKRTNLEKHIAMNSSFVTPQAIAGSERNQFKLSMFIAMEQSATLLWRKSENMKYLS